MPRTNQRWDVFCSVIDNFGDVGVAWRLARQLAGEHAIAVRLFVDHPAALRRIAPEGASGVDVRHWHGPSGDFLVTDATPADAVIEMFSCGLPAAYLDAMGAQPTQACWINLEYLSAETWVEDSHGLASRQPQRPLTRHFLFPGYTSRTAGLLRERGLFARRDAFRTDAAAQAALWCMLGIDTPASGTLTLSLFCYPNPGLPSLLDTWAAGERPILCLVPEGVASAELEAWTGNARWLPGQVLRQRNLTLACVPFVPQDDYDRMLWACDLNFVRGEDSLVRAQWAARPLVWHAYPQAGDAQRPKLDAFLSRYALGLPPDVAAAQSTFMQSWNGRSAPADAWPAFARALPVLDAHAPAWAASLAAKPDLASTLVEFVEKMI